MDGTVGRKSGVKIQQRDRKGEDEVGTLHRGSEAGFGRIGLVAGHPASSPQRAGEGPFLWAGWHLLSLPTTHHQLLQESPVLQSRPLESCGDPQGMVRGQTLWLALQSPGSPVITWLSLMAEKTPRPERGVWAA